MCFQAANSYIRVTGTHLWQEPYAVLPEIGTA